MGFHAGVAPAEWHLHTWDLAAAIGETYRPAEAGVIFTGLREVFPIPPMDWDPWENTLLLSGRA